MKIRCKNCYRVLDRNEEYCKSCGEHSEAMKQAMITGNFSGGPLDRLKIGLILFFTLAFLGNGIIMTLLAVIKEDATMSLYNRSYAMIFSSVIAFIVIIIIHSKDLKDFLWNGNNQQLLGAVILGTIFIVMTCLLPKLTSFTQVLPTYLIDYFQSGKAVWFSGESTSLALILLSLILIAIVEEIIFRRLLVDALDDATLLSDTSIIILVGIISTVLDFAWIMAPETLIVSLLLHMLLTGIYANTNRSLGLNILIRILVIVCQFVLFLV